METNPILRFDLTARSMTIWDPYLHKTAGTYWDTPGFPGEPVRHSFVLSLSYCHTLMCSVETFYIVILS